jgi:hypothetical protein
MLEPYQVHHARKRITLVSAGWVGRGIASLRFSVTEWKEVFETRRAAGTPPFTREQVIGKAVSDLVGGGESWAQTMRRRYKGAAVGVWSEEEENEDEGEEMLLLDAFQGID